MPRGFWRLNMTLDVLLLFYGIGFSMELEQDMQLYEWVLIGHWTRMVWKWLKRESCVMKSVVVPKAPGAASGSATKGHLNFIVSDASFVKSTKRGRLSSVSIWLPSFLLILTFYSSVNMSWDLRGWLWTFFEQFPLQSSVHFVEGIYKRYWPSSLCPLPQNKQTTLEFWLSNLCIL